MRDERPELARHLGLTQTTAIALGAMIGAGVYVSLGEAARTTGGSLVLAVLIGGFVATLNALSSAELGANLPVAGGAYEFGRRFLHPAVGFLAGWLFALAALAAGATYALTFTAYLQPLLPGVPLRLVGLALLALATALNAAGVRLSSLVNVALVVVNVAVLAVFVAVAAPRFQVSGLRPFLPGGVVGLLQAGALLFFAYTGYARPVTVAEEIREPRATLPRAVSLAVAVTAVLYMAIALSALGAAGPMGLAGQAPLRSVMEVTGGGIAPLLLSLGALLASTTVLLTEIWGLSRLLFAMARNGDLPRWLAHLSGDERIPRRAVLVVGVLLLVLGAVADLRPALEASSLGLLIYYGVMNLSALRLTPEQRLYPRAVPVAGALSCALLAFSLPWQTILIVATVAAVGLVWWWVRR
ncbi:MAG: APC family permease [Anaerolineae bacterium]